MTTDEKNEWLKCWHSPLYFIWNYCQIYDAVLGEWIAFRLYPKQVGVLSTILNNLLTIILKARQLGMTWLVLAFALWLMLFRPIATILVFSKRDDEAVYLLGSERMRGMYSRLPKFLQARSVTTDNDHEWALSNGSVARAFPTSAGDSYTATLAFVDEADLVPDLNRLMNAVKPTIDAGGRMILLSRVDKSQPQSEFKRIYRAAKAKLNGWIPIFLPWRARPERTEEWYEQQKRDVLARTGGSLDNLYQQYPATDTEALAPATLDKRIASAWLEQCYVEMAPLADDELPENAPSIPGLNIYRLPTPDARFVIGADPAEGNPTSDDSALEVLDRETGEEVACLAGKFQPATFASHIDTIGNFFNRADLMVERNNHGHAVLLWLKDNSSLHRLKGYEGKIGISPLHPDKLPKEGWLSNTKGKAILYDTCADTFREDATILHNFETYTQLSLIEGSTLRAPEGENDDRADAFALATVAYQDRFNAGTRLVNDVRRLREEMEAKKSKETS